MINTISKHDQCRSNGKQKIKKVDFSYAENDTRRKLHDRCWEYVSKIVRMSAIFNNSEQAGCYTCGKVFHWKELECGHAEHDSSPFAMIDFCFDMLRPQCSFCNQHKKGNLGIYLPKLINEIGADRVEAGRKIKHMVNEMTIDDYKALKANLKIKLKEVKAKYE